MKQDTDTIRCIIDQLEQTLSQLDKLDAKFAAIHIDHAIVDLCNLSNVDRSSSPTEEQ